MLQNQKRGKPYFTFFLIIILSGNNKCFVSGNNYKEPIIKVTDISMSDINEGFKIDRYLMLYKDESKRLGINDIVNKEFLSNSGAVSLGYNNDADWIKFNVYSNKLLRERTILKIDKLLLDSVYLYYFNNHLQMGFNTRRIGCSSL